MTGFMTNRLRIQIPQTLNFAGSLGSANSSILAVQRLFKDFGGEKSGFYDN